MIAYWERDCEWMGEGLILAVCPSFTGPTGLQAIDVSGRSNHGTPTGMDRNTSYQTIGGKVALDFNGIDNWIASPLTTPATTQLSMSCWSRLRSTGGQGTGFSRLFSRANTSQFALSYTSSGLSVAINGSASNFAYTASSTTFDHFCATWDGATIRMHVNGAQLGSASYSGTLAASTTAISLGGVSGLQRTVDGFVDDWRLYLRALTAPEARQLYERDRAGGMLYQPASRRSYYAQLAAAFSILAESGSYILSGQPIPLLYGRALSADTGSVLLSGQTTSLLTSRLLNADQGSYAYSGTDAATLLGRLLDAGAAAYTLDGNAAGFIASRRISADTVAYLASGLDAGFLRSRVLEAGTGQYVLVASPVNLQTGTPGTGGAAPYYYLFLLGGSR